MFLRGELFYIPPIVCGSSVIGIVLLCISLRPFSFCNQLDEEERFHAVCFDLIVFLMSCDS